MKRLLLDSSSTALERSLLSSVDLDVPPLGALEKVRVMATREEETALAPAVVAHRSPERVQRVAVIACTCAMAAGFALFLVSRAQHPDAVRKDPTLPMTTAEQRVPVAPPPPETALAPAQAEPPPSSPPPPPSPPLVGGPTVPARTCDPPFWYDAQGVKHDKPHCMGGRTSDLAPALLPAPPASTSTFDRYAAAAALGKVDLSSCKEIEGPDGTGHVTVTFVNDGSVQSAVVDQGPYAGTARGACVAAKFRAATVPPFEGAPVRVGKSFVL